jgi:trehalose 6-phosphate phosphatase
VTTELVVDGALPNHCLFFGADGALLDLANRPDAVTVPRELVAALSAANDRLDGAVALVSGRPIADLDILFAPLRLCASGVHGTEIRHAPDGACERFATKRLSESAWYELAQLLERFPGTHAEDKGVSYAVHYRTDEATEIALMAALDAFMRGQDPSGLELVRGRRVLEIKPAGFDQGQAIERFMQRPPFLGRIPILIADEESDESGFRTTLALGGQAFSVGQALPGLTGAFPHPSAVRDWLMTLAG